MLEPKNAREEKDCLRVELWQDYEEELLDKMGQRDAAIAHKQQLEKAVESPLYRKHGKRQIGVHLHRDCEGWLKKRKDKSSEV